jgi:hypothetical protein
MLSFLKKLFGKLFGCKPVETNAPYKIEAAVKSVADVNKDGKVNLADAKAVVHKAATQVAKSAHQVAKKTAPKKPRKPKAPKV